MLDQHPHESLHGAVDSSVDHHGAMRFVVAADVLQPESLGKLVVELNCRTLPLPTDGIAYLDVDLGPVERASPLVDPIRDVLPLQCPEQRLLGDVPHVVGPDFFLRPGGEVQAILQAERLVEHKVSQIEHAIYFIFDLVLGAKDMSVVHREAPHTQHAVQGSRALVAVHVGHFRQPDG